MPSLDLTIPATTTVLPLTLAVAAVVVDHARRNALDLRVLAWRLAFLAYVALLVTVTFFPFHVAIGGWRNPWQTGVNLVPGASVGLVSYKLNILMTVPLGFVLPIVTRVRGLVAVTAIGTLTSCAIELLQYAQRIVLGGDRSTDVDDVIANTIGTALGVLALRAAVAAVDVARRRAAQGGRRVRRSADSSVVGQAR